LLENPANRRGFFQGEVSVSLDENIQRRPVDKSIACLIHELDPALPQLVGLCLRYLPGHKNEISGLAGLYQRKQYAARGIFFDSGGTFLGPAPFYKGPEIPRSL